MEKDYCEVLALSAIQSTQLMIEELMTLPGPHPPPNGLQKKTKSEVWEERIAQIIRGETSLCLSTKRQKEIGGKSLWLL